MHRDVTVSDLSTANPFICRYAIRLFLVTRKGCPARLVNTMSLECDDNDAAGPAAFLRATDIGRDLQDASAADGLNSVDLPRGLQRASASSTRATSLTTLSTENGGVSEPCQRGGTHQAQTRRAHGREITKPSPR